MASLNCVHIIGNLGGDPDVRYTTSGACVCTLNVATNSRWKDKETGEQKERTEWHKCVLWGRDAENANTYLKKGSPVYLQGELQTRKWEDKEGIERYTTEIRVLRMQFLGQKSGTRPPHPADDSSAPSAGQQGQTKPDAKSAEPGPAGDG